MNQINHPPWIGGHYKDGPHAKVLFLAHSHYGGEIDHNGATIDCILEHAIENPLRFFAGIQGWLMSFGTR